MMVLNLNLNRYGCLFLMMRNYTYIRTFQHILSCSPFLFFFFFFKGRMAICNWPTCSLEGRSCHGMKELFWWATTWENSSQHPKEEVDTGAVSILQPVLHLCCLFQRGIFSYTKLQALPQLQPPTNEQTTIRLSRAMEEIKSKKSRRRRNDLECVGGWKKTSSESSRYKTSSRDASKNAKRWCPSALSHSICLCGNIQGGD